LEIDGRRILSDIYLKCETGKITGMLGRNGEGKSSLLNIIYGSLQTEKSIRIDNIAHANACSYMHLLRYLTQANFIPQQLSLEKVFEDFELDFLSFEKRFQEFSLRYKSSINSLLGGEQRLVELYIIVKSRTHFAMLDEPFTHLNYLQIEKAKELILAEKENKGLLITDHMFRHVIDISDILYVLKNGKTHLITNLQEIEKLGYARL
jgi:ABC-type lipopolysaccharide export system ATPase subunit